MIKRAFHKALYAVPGAEGAWIGLNRLFGRWRPHFTGWGMTTDSMPPWLGGGIDPLAQEFLAVHSDLTDRVRRGAFDLTQFHDAPDQVRVLRELMWRHYLVFWSARSAARSTATPTKTLVECGVCDGLTAFFAMRAMNGAPFHSILYDAWQRMTTPSGTYDDIALETTQSNLSDFARETTYVKGFLPESFSTAPLPSDVTWLHIDLNAASPTAAALETLYDRMAPGSVILFDDYGWPAYRETKHAIDAFAADKRGVLLPVPTGQGLFFKHG